MKNIILVVLSVIVIAIEACFIINEFNVENETVENNIEVICLQDCQCHDGIWYYGEIPVVFDESVCEIMNSIMNENALFTTLYVNAENVNNDCYVIHLN